MELSTRHQKRQCSVDCTAIRPPWEKVLLKFSECFLPVFFDHFLCELFLWCAISRVMQIHAEIRPHLRRLRKVISASQRLSNSRQTPLEMQTKCFSPYSYVCDRFGGSPSLISCTKSFFFYYASRDGEKGMIYHQVTFMRKTRQHNFASGGLEG